MRHDACDWIGLLAIAVALHGWHQGFQPVYPCALIALAVIGLVLAYCIRV
jgi:pantothenate kinase-related protein Tda10